MTLRNEIEHFIIEYDDIDKPCIDRVSEALESSYERITNNLNQKLAGKLVVGIYFDRDKLHNDLGFPDAPDWIRGGLGKGKIAIASPLNPPPGSKFDNVINTAVHEFVHMIVNKINDNTPRWLNEGIACFEAKDNSEEWIKETVKNGIITNTIPTFRDLDTGEDFETFFNRNGYQYSYTIIEVIVKEFGYERLYKLIKTPNNFAGVFGLSENELQSKWLEYIKKSYI